MEVDEMFDVVCFFEMVVEVAWVAGLKLYREN
jgi:hypothetical protein